MPGQQIYLMMCDPRKTQENQVEAFGSILCGLNPFTKFKAQQSCATQNVQADERFCKAPKQQVVNI